MVLFVEGNVMNRGKFARFLDVKQDLPSILGQKINTAVSDVFFVVTEVGEGQIKLRLEGHEDKEERLLRLGESTFYHHVGNAYGYSFTFSLKA